MVLSRKRASTRPWTRTNMTGGGAFAAAAAAPITAESRSKVWWRSEIPTYRTTDRQRLECGPMPNDGRPDEYRWHPLFNAHCWSTVQ